MKIKILLLSALFFCQFNFSYGQCNLTDATGCLCADGSADCDLLPDIQLSWYALQTYNGGPTEYPQTGAGVENGRLRVTGSTPNTGYGPFTVRGEDDHGLHMFVCGTDTFTAPASTTFVCPNGFPTPKQILWQRIYKKAGSAMQYTDRIAGAMTYEQNAMHVDDWGIMSLRLQDPNEPDPRKWSMVGIGHKQSFCLMDYGSCSTYNGHCRDDNTVFNQGTTLLNPSFPNWGLGNNYGCSSVEQGCSVGYTDIYNESLNGMWIDIPPGTCNGDYWIVYEIDPHDYFIESDETNNYTAIPFTLTLQNAPGTAAPIVITPDRNPVSCGNDSVTLTASAGTIYAWSNGATTQSIRVLSGTYSVTVTNYCGVATSSPMVVTSLMPPNPPIVADTLICTGYSATFNATGTNVVWYDLSNVQIGTGNTFTTPILTTTTQYRAVDQTIFSGTNTFGGKADSLGAGGYFSGNQWLIFNALKPLSIKSVKMFANGSGNRTIQLINSSGTLLQSGVFFLPNGESRVNLNFEVPQGNAYELHIAGTSNCWRNNGGVTYPYTITDTLSITGSNAGATYYYFFYDWEVEVGGGKCPSVPALVTATVDVCNGIDPTSDLSKNISVSPNPSSGIFNIEIIMPGSGEDVSINVTDLLGKTVYTKIAKNISGNYRTDIELTKAAKGIYYLNTEIGNRKYVKKIVKL